MSFIGDITGANQAAEAAVAAAETQAGAAQTGIGEQRRQFDAIQQMMAPYMQAGTGALESQQALTGLAGPEAQRAAIAQIQASPQLQAQMQAGEEAMLQQGAATGGLRGGNIQGALAQFRPQMLNQAIQQQFGQLGGISGAGLGAAGQTAGAGQASASNIANLLQQQGAATAGGQVAAGQVPGQVFGDVMGGLGLVAGFSDKRLKDNIIKIGEVANLNVYKWDWNEKAQELGINNAPIGFIAQEAQELYPDYVYEIADTGYLGIDYESILKDK